MTIKHETYNEHLQASRPTRRSTPLNLIDEDPMGPWKDYPQNYTPRLLCPICGHEQTHLTGVSMCVAEGGQSDPGEGDAEIQTLGVVPTIPRWIETAPVGMKPPDRFDEYRPAFALYGYCESGHNFIVNLVQHTGVTYLSAVEVGAISLGMDES